MNRSPIRRWVESLSEQDRAHFRRLGAELWTDPKPTAQLVVAAYQEIIVWEAEQDRIVADLLEPLEAERLAEIDRIERELGLGDGSAAP